MLLFAAAIVGFDAFLAYATALGKTFLKKQLAGLEKRQEETAQKLVMLIRRKKSLEGTRKFLRRLREERTAELSSLIAEFNKWESGEVPAEFAGDAEEAQASIQQEAGVEGQAQELATEAGESGTKTEEAGGRTAGVGGSTGEGEVDLQDGGDERNEREIKVKAPVLSRNVDFGPRRRRIKPNE